MKKNFILKNWAAGVLLLAASVFKAEAEEVTIKSGTPIPLLLEQTITSKNVASGTIINFKCTRDIVVDGKVAIRAGEMAKGQVSHVKKNGILGRAGEIEIRVTSISAVDGSEVYLTANSLYDDGKSKLVLSLFLCFFIKGSNGEIPAGTQCVANVSSNTVVNIN